MTSIGLIQVILVLCFVKPCASDVCSKKICQCTNFGMTRVKVKCQVHGYIPTGIPSNTVIKKTHSSFSKACYRVLFTLLDLFRPFLLLQSLFSFSALNHGPSSSSISSKTNDAIL